MSISEPFIRRPIATSLLMVGLTLTGMVAYKQLAVSALPQVDYPTIVVSTLLPGASGDTMVATVTTPLERQFGQIPSLAAMTSVSSFGSSQVTLQFTLDRSIDAAEQDVQAAINAASNLLPRTLPAPPTYSKSNPADTPILILSVHSDSMPLDQVDDMADSILGQKISQVAGVGLVTLNGGQKPAIRVQVDPEDLAGTDLTMEDVRSAIVAANVNQPKGNLDGPRQDYTLATDDQLGKADTFKPLVLAYRNGAAVRIRDISDVIDGVENTQLAGWAGNKRAIILNVQRQPGANVIQVAESVKKLLPKLAASLPQGLQVDILADRTSTVRASVDDVQQTLVLTVVLVVLVIFLFLRSARATVIPGVAVPLSLIGTFGVMYLLNYSLNNLSLMALTIATGFVVDDAIVMVENISRFIEEGMPPFEAALKGSKQIGFTIVSLTVSLIAVLIPLLFMSGLIGRLFREFAVTLSVSIGVSAVLSLTLTAMMCAHLLKPHDPTHQENAFFRGIEGAWTAFANLYEAGLKVVLNHQLITLLVTLATVGFTAYLFIEIPKGFFPEQDTGMVLGVTQAPVDVSFSRMMDLQTAVSRELQKDEAVATVASFIGSDGTNDTPNSGRFSITLKSKEERADPLEVVLARLQSRAAKVEGITLYLQPVQDLQIDTRVSRTQYQFTLEDADAAELALWAPQVIGKLQHLPQLADVASDLQENAPQLSVVIDRETASRLGITTQIIDDTLYDSFGQRLVSTIFTQLNQYRVILEVKPGVRDDPHALDRLYVRAATGDVVPLSAVAKFVKTSAPLAVHHQGQFPAVTVSFNLGKDSSLGQAVSAIDAELALLKAPPGLHPTYTGSVQAFLESLASEPALILAALITVYIVLGVLYESFIHPITILSTLPSAGVGALLALEFCHTEFSIIALIGVVLLIGIVKKNAIMMIDFAVEATRDQGLSPQDAIHQACVLRFRPIMMTTMAALLGGLPMALENGTGSELRKPLGISIVGGLIFSQVLTLFTTPVIYLYMDKVARWLGMGEAARPTDSEAGPKGIPEPAHEGGGL